MEYTPFERIVQWFNRPKRCIECGTTMDGRSGDTCSGECADAFELRKAY